jgi:RNA polymerase sigma factor (TIGR02999 family)
MQGQEHAENFRASPTNPPGGPTSTLFDLLYSQLHAIAEAQMSRERPGLTLQPTALVHEAFVRLSADPAVVWDNPRHFYAAAGQAMRRILVERARRVSRHKHGGGRRRVPLDESDLAQPQASDDPEAMLALDRAMDELRALDPTLAEVVTLRYFAGLSVEQTAEALARSPRSIKYDWSAARAWLLRRMNTGPDGGTG